MYNFGDSVSVDTRFSGLQRSRNIFRTEVSQISLGEGIQVDWSLAYTILQVNL